MVKGLRAGFQKYRALILYNFELKYLRALLDREEATRVMTHYHPNVTQAAEKRSNTREFKAWSDYTIGLLFQNVSEQDTSYPDLLPPCGGGSAN